jgi:hypothetical protein
MRKREVRQWYIPGRESPDDRLWTEVQLDIDELMALLGLPSGTRMISAQYNQGVITVTAEEPREALCPEPSSSGSSAASPTG